MEQVRKKKYEKTEKCSTNEKESRCKAKFYRQAEVKRILHHQDQINEEEISNLPEKELRVMIVKMIRRLENRMEKIQDAFNTVNAITRDIEEIKNKQTEITQLLKLKIL